MSVSAPNPSRQAGYTLVEMLASLLVLSLAFFGLTTATRVFSLTARATAARTDQAALGRRLELYLGQAMGPGPYRGAADFGAPTLQGDQIQARFDCGDGQTCRLTLATGPSRLVIAQDGASRTLALPAGPAAFRYLTADGRSTDSFPTAGTDRLAALAVLSNGQPLGLVNLRKQQPDACDFDAAAGDCLTGRGGTP
jgi:prepilin-type N-terminal cleavage/methylation domain-containing protein